MHERAYNYLFTIELHFLVQPLLRLHIVVQFLALLGSHLIKLDLCSFNHAFFALLLGEVFLFSRLILILVLSAPLARAGIIVKRDRGESWLPGWALPPFKSNPASKRIACQPGLLTAGGNGDR